MNATMYHINLGKRTKAQALVNWYLEELNEITDNKLVEVFVGYIFKISHLLNVVKANGNMADGNTFGKLKAYATRYDKLLEGGVF